MFTNCTACTTSGPVVYVLVLSVCVSSVYTNGFGRSIISIATPLYLSPVWSEPACQSVYCDIAFNGATK